MASEQGKASSKIFVRDLRNFSRPFASRDPGREGTEDAETTMHTGQESSLRNKEVVEHIKQVHSGQNRQNLGLPEDMHRQASGKETVASEVPLQDNPDEMHRRFGDAWETLTEKSKGKETLKDALAAMPSQAMRDKARSVWYRSSEGRSRP